MQTKESGMTLEQKRPAPASAFFSRANLVKHRYALRPATLRSARKPFDVVGEEWEQPRMCMRGFIDLRSLVDLPDFSSADAVATGGQWRQFQAGSTCRVRAPPLKSLP